jgi:phage recombination protein Bet
MTKSAGATKRAKEKTPEPKTEAIVPSETLAPAQATPPASAGVMTLAPPRVLAMAAPPSNEWEGKLELIRRTYAAGTSDDEFELFCHVAKVRHLDPLQRQIYAVVRSVWNSDTESYEKRMTIQTGIDGYRAIANRTGEYMPSDRPPLIEDMGTVNARVTVFVKKWSKHDQQWHEFSATALYREFVQTRKKGQEYIPVAMWKKMPINQTTKCAEALALRRGWPEELGNIYVEEEMQQLDGDQRGAATPPKAASERAKKGAREVGTLTPSSSPNRGHGNEGMEQKFAPAPDAAPPTPKDFSKASRIETTVEKVVPKMKNPPAAKVLEAKREGKPIPEGQPYFILMCAGDIALYVWDTNFHPELVKSQKKPLIALIEEHKSNSGKAYKSLVDVISLNGVPFENGKPKLTKDEKAVVESYPAEKNEHGVTGVFSSSNHSEEIEDEEVGF